MALESWKLTKVIFLVWAREVEGLFDDSHELGLVSYFIPEENRSCWFAIWKFGPSSQGLVKW